MSKIFKSFDDNELNKIAKSEEFQKVANNEKINDFVNNKQFQEFKERYKGKSDEEILRDARKMSQKLKEQYGEEEYKKKIEDLKNFEKFLSPQQRKKMKKFLDSIR